MNSSYPLISPVSLSQPGLLMSPPGYLVLVSGLYSVMVCYTVHGWSQLIGSSQPIVSAVGDDVILPCHVERRLSMENMTVIWWKHDVAPDPSDPMSDYRYVHCYQSNQNNREEDLQMKSYVSRTSLFTDNLKHGNISLKIRKVKLSDGGMYRCDVPQLLSDSVIELVVVKTWTTETTPQPENIKPPDVAGGRVHLLALIPLIPLVVFISLILIGECQKYDVAPTEPLPVRAALLKGTLVVDAEQHVQPQVDRLDQ